MRAAWRWRVGGELARLAVAHAARGGGYTGGSSPMPVTIWSAGNPAIPAGTIGGTA